MVKITIKSICYKMPQCVTCRQTHPSNSGGKLFIDVDVNCSICLESHPSNENWILPCGHSNCKECLTNMGFSEKDNEVASQTPVVQTPVQNNIIPENIRCPVNRSLHKFRFNEATSSYANNYESYKCMDCNLINGENQDIYKQTCRIIRNRIQQRQNNCNHQWERTGGNYSMDINFYTCRLCDAHQTR